MTSQALPETIEGLLQTGLIDPSFEAAWKTRGSPPGDMPADVPTLKSILASSLPSLQQKLATTRPPNITEIEHHLSLTTGFNSRVLICHTTPPPDSPPAPGPIILLFHGGIHLFGYPEFDLPLARTLASAHNMNATVILPSTRKAPETPFPFMLHDSFAILQLVAQDSLLPIRERKFLPPHCNPYDGFIVGGASSGANFADVTAHLARDQQLKPPLTGMFLACGGYMDPERGVPVPYRELYLAREQNKDAPGVNGSFIRDFVEAVRPERGSRLWAPFEWGLHGGSAPEAVAVEEDEHDGDHGDRVKAAIASGHMDMPPAYFQVCGMDVNRDDGLVYESVLRKECGVRTRVDLYLGMPHCWWDAYPELEASQKRMEDTIQGFRWLLGPSQTLQQIPAAARVLIPEEEHPTVS